MKSALVLLAAGATSVSALLPAYAQCGGLSWWYDWQCEVGTTCSPVGTNAFPDYQCLPNTGPIILHVFPYGQCGGANFAGGKLCPPYWTCFKINEFFSQCVQDADYVTPPNVTPGIVSPGGLCARDGGQAAICAPGYVCTGPGVFGYSSCTLEKPITPPVTTTTSVVNVTTTLITTTKSTTSAKTTTTKKTTSTKKTTTSKRPATTVA